MKIKTSLVLLLFLTLLPLHTAAQSDSTIVYNEEHPLIYEDAWDLWPYVFLNENGEPDGYNVDLLKIIFKELDIPFVIKLKPTLEAQEDLRNRKSDLMLRMDANFARNSSSYGKTIVQLFTHSLVTPKNKSFDIKTLADLTDKTVIVHVGSFSHHYLIDNQLRTNIETYDDMQEAIQKVSAENNGIILWNTMSLKWLMQKYQTDNLELTPFELPYGEYKFFSNDLHLLAQLDSVHNQLRANDRLTPIQNKWFYPERRETGIPSWIWQLIYIFILAALVFLAYFFIYKVRERRVTKEIRRSNERLSQILSSSQVSFWTYDVKTQQFTIMDQSGKATKTYSQLNFSRLYKPDDFLQLMDAIQQIIDGKAETISLNLQAKPEETAEMHEYATTLSVMRRNNFDKPTVILCSESDVTSEKARQQKVNDTRMRYQTIFNTSMIGMVYYDENGYITDINKRALNKMGVTIEEIQKMRISIQDVLGEKDFSIDDMEEIHMTQIYHSTDERPLQKILKRGNIYYELKFVPVRDSQNKLICIYGAGHDVTEIVNSYMQLQENVKELQEANKEMSDYVRNIDYVMTVGSINMVTYHPDTHLLTIYSEIGHPRFTLTQTRTAQLISEESRKQVMRIVNRMDNKTSDNIRLDVKTSIRLKGGKPLYLQLNFIPIYNNGEIQYYYGMCRDISELKAIEEQLAKETLRAQEVEVIKNAFLHNMSHEIRTPLTSVVGFSELFQMEHSTDDEAIFIDEIKKSSAALLKLINDILFLSRLDAGMITLTPRSIDFASIFEDRCVAAWKWFHEPDVDYIAKSPCKRLVVEIDEAKVSMIIDKIVTNAAQHTQHGTVFARYDYIGDQLIVSVEDTGCGIPAEAIEHIFERFVTGANYGAGLGLSICHELIEFMGGEIHLKSTQGIGTTVWFTLPCKLIEMERI